MQHFTTQTSNELWSRLSESQKRIAKDHPLAKCLPKKQDIRGIFSLICEALNNKGEDVSSICYDVNSNTFRFRTKTSEWLYETLVEHSPTYQVLPETLHELIQWRVQ